MAQQSDSRATNSDAQAASESVNASSNSDAASKEAAGDMAAPYGTRSRNRTGSSRINYAEDKDIDADVYDYYHDKKDQDGASKKSARQANAAANGEGPRGGVAARRAAASEEAKLASSQNAGRDTASSAGGASQGAQQTSTSSGGAPASRKRKAAATGAAPSTRRAGQSTPASGTTWPDTNMLSFESCKSRPDSKGRMVADDGTVLEPDDHVYLVCEPPGEPYYLGRIMEFLHAQNDSANKVDAVRINWYYRPKDIGRKTTDTRLLFATMHSDVSPLTALRGKCTIRHRVDIPSMEEFRKTPDSFWFEKLYDRYIQKNYDLIPTSSIVNVPDRVKKVLDERWKFVLVEQGRGKELTSAVKLCKRCSGYCASNDSVDCAVCQNTYHMNCVRPPLLKKPSRGFAWSCAACSRAQERRLEARNTPNAADPDDDDFLDDDDDDLQGIETDRNTPDNQNENHQGTPEQIYQASLWPWRYLGMHCKPEDALDYDDRIHPRAGTRIGPRHQANVHPWPGRPVQYVKPLETRRGRGIPKLSKEAQAAQESEKAARGKRPKWVQDQPPGYQSRGEDLDENDPNATSTRLWVPPPPEGISNEDIAGYMTKSQGMAKKLGLPERSTNLQDIALETLYRDDYDSALALKTLPSTEKALFKEPILTANEQKKFEEGVSLYGSELHLVMKHAKTMTPGEVVRFYYTWKKTERGKHVWGSYPGRKGKKFAKREDTAQSRAADDVADRDDDSAFDADKAVEKKRSFMCQFCSTTSSRQWRRGPNTSQSVVDEHDGKADGKDGDNQYVMALCRRCAELWRRYAIKWEDMEEVAKKVAQTGGKAWKRKQDEELLKELVSAKELGLLTPDRDDTPSAGANGHEPPRKKLKGAPEKDVDLGYSDGGNASGSTVSRKKDRTADATPAPEMPKPRTLPCAICDQMEPLGDQHVSCRECRMTVHRNCYGVLDNRVQGKWICDMCANDKSPQVSIHYKCVLCPVEYTEQDFVEQPKLTHHKKKMADKDREREKAEVMGARKAAEYYRKRQEELNRPVNPREPLKRTADNNWVHVTCAIWTPEVKFGNAKALEPSEGIPSIPRARYEETCQACNQQGGACVACHQCRVPFHVECARQQGHLLAFDVTPVKSSRRDQFNIVTVNGESGTMSALLWCKDHIPMKTIAHKMYDVVDESGLNALQLYVQTYKQADLTLTGTVRKANLLMMSAAKMSGMPLAPGLRRTSTTTVPNGPAPQSRPAGDSADAATDAQHPGEKVCITCGIDVTPKWWPIDNTQEQRLTNGHHGSIGFEAQKFVEQRKFQCHKCKKNPRTPKSFMARPSPPPMSSEPPRHHMPGSNQQSGALPPRSPPRPSMPDYRPPPGPLRPEIHSLLHHPASHPPPPPPPPPVAVAVGHGPGGIGHHAHSPHSQHHSMAPRPAPVSHGYPQVPAPRQSAYSDWGSQHNSPPRHINGGPPPPIHGSGPPSVASLTSLRPPSMSGPPPVAPLNVQHQHPHGSPIYGSAMPPSPRRLNGPSPPSSYVPAYGAPPPPPPSHGHAPRLSASPGVSSGILPPRGEPFSHGLHLPRSAYPGGTHGSPPMARNGLPPPGGPPPPPPPGHEQAPPPSVGLRPPESRPASGASASPSLRNLLS